jgi:rhodanese-related sulfurtransferase
MQIRDILTEKRLRHLEPMVAEINVHELKNKIDAGEIFKLIEVSNPEHFQQGHIKSAINIPVNSLEQAAAQQFKKFQQILLYSQDANSSVGTVAARMLQRAGFSVLVLKGGKEAWKNAGFPLEGQSNDKS